MNTLVINYPRFNGEGVLFLTYKHKTTYFRANFVSRLALSYRGSQIYLLFM